MKNKIIILFSLLVSVAFSAYSQKDLKVMTYNIRNAKGMDKVCDFQRVANVINNALPDVVAVQELDSVTRRSEGKYVLGEVAERTQMHATYCPTIPFSGGKYGIGILSREKPLSLKTKQLPGTGEKRALLVAEFEDYVFCCTHLSLREEDRMLSLDYIREAAEGYDKPFFLAGDLNALPDSEFIKKLQENFRIISDVKQPTFPAPEPTETIDYIAVYKKEKEPFSVLSSKVIEEPMASDHRPILIELRMATDADVFF